MAGALDGYRVLDLSRILSGPYCTMALADFGAEVIKVERPGSGDDTRAWGPPFVGGESAYYLSINRSKRSITVDLGQEAGARDHLRARPRLRRGRSKTSGPEQRIASASVTSGLRQENPRLIYCSISGFGQEGPYRDRPGYDALAQAMSGMMAITGEPDGPPSKAWHVDRRHRRGHVGSVFDRHRPPRPRADRRGSVHRHLAPGRADLVANLRGGQLLRDRRKPGALWLRSSQHRSLSAVRDRRRLSHAGSRQRPTLATVLRRRGRPESGDASRDVPPAPNAW